MIHEDVTSGTEERSAGGVKEQKSALFAVTVSIMPCRFSEHEFTGDGSIHPPGDTSPHGSGWGEGRHCGGKRSYLSMLFCSSTFIGLFPVD